MTSQSDNAFDLTAALRSVDQIIAKVFKRDLRKAIDPLSSDGFMVVQNRLRKAVAGLSKEAEAEALRNAIAELDIDWPNATRMQRVAAVTAARSVLSQVPEPALDAMGHTLTVHGKRITKATMASQLGALRVGVKPDLYAVDERVIEQAATRASSFIRDAWGKRSDVMSKKAREIVADAMRDGASRKEIIELLRYGLGEAGAAHSDAYYGVVANAFANSARSWGNLQSMKRAGITKYRVVAVLDKRTTVQCRLMHGKTFTVQAGLDAYHRTDALKDPEGVKSTQPWIQVGKDEDGASYVYYKRGDGSRQRIANVTEDAFGRVDQRGKFSDETSTAALAKAGISTPPFHGNCRTTIDPIVSSKLPPPVAPKEHPAVRYVDKVGGMHEAEYLRSGIRQASLEVTRTAFAGAAPEVATQIAVGATEVMDPLSSAEKILAPIKVTIELLEKGTMARLGVKQGVATLSSTEEVVVNLIDGRHRMLTAKEAGATHIRAVVKIIGRDGNVVEEWTGPVKL